MLLNKPNQRILIFSGGRLGKWALEQIKADDYLIGVDRGALYLVEHHYEPHFAIGDFDSVNEQELARIKSAAHKWEACPVNKDWTDTELAFNYSLKAGARNLLIFGGVGTRFDHSLANVYLLKRALEKRVACIVEDQFNRIQLIGKNEKLHIERGRFSFVSLLPLTEVVEGISLTGFRYSLQEARLQMGETLGISNELIEQKGTVTIQAGKLLVISSKDESGMDDREEVPLS